MVLGHEGVGIVEAVGSSITRFNIGDRIGFGYAKDGCGKCETCLAGNSYPCEVAPRNFGAQDLDQGSFSDFSVWPETDLYKIPDALSSAEAAPLFCAGMTVFTPMFKFGIKTGHRVGIIGIGGLGHLAIQYGAKLGGEVVVFSGSADKEKEAIALGAKEFFVTKELGEKKPEKKLDYLVITANGHPDWNV
jgi:D-arabinose 1-dehydrogenase-like Zn-dependent alcohol dehydrogenase